MRERNGRKSLSCSVQRYKIYLELILTVCNCMVLLGRVGRRRRRACRVVTTNTRQPQSRTGQSRRFGTQEKTTTRNGEEISSVQRQHRRGRCLGRLNKIRISNFVIFTLYGVENQTIL